MTDFFRGSGKIGLMRKLSWMICMIAGLAWAESGPDLFQKALVAERADGKLEEAIKLYQRIAQKFPQDRNLTAKALLQLGQCYEKLGDVQARKAYDRVVREYGDQSEIASAARGGLGRLGAEVGAKQAEGVRLRHVQVADGLEDVGGISPDGQYLSFVEDGHGFGELSILNLATGQKRQVTRGASHNKNAREGAELSVFSPDGKQLAYGWHTPANSDQLRTIQIDGSGMRTLFRTDHPSWIQTHGWAGGNILIKSGDRDSQENHILVISAADGAVRKLKTLRNPQPQVKLSPDGSWVAVNHRAGGLSLVSTADGREVPVLQPASDSVDLSEWTPDGKMLIYSVGNNMQTNLYGMRIENGQVVGAPLLVRSNLALGRTAGVTRLGSLYYTSNGHLSLNVFAAAIDAETGKMQSEPGLATSLSVGENRWLSWSTDGSKLACVTNMNYQQREHNIAILDEGTGRVREIAPHLYPLVALSWRPDGKALAALGPSPNGRQGVYSIDARTGEATGIAMSDAPSATLLDPVFSPDGKSLLYRKADANSVTILLRNLSDGRTREVYRGAARRRSVVFSPDGSQLAFMADRSILIQPLAGGEARTIYTLAEGEDFQGVLGLAWMPNGKRVLFLKQPVNPPNGPVPVTVWSVGVEGGEAVKTGLTMPGITGLSVHPSGKRIGFSAAKWNPSDKTEVWVLEGFAKLP
ncbi:MAG: tetratricopeptide repeat protein [Bryobacteraceae bacterium]